MKIKHFLPALCMALGLAAASPLAAGATGNVGTQTEHTAKTESNGWHKDASTQRLYYVRDGKRVTGFQKITMQLESGKRTLLYYFEGNGLQAQFPNPGKVTINGDYYYSIGSNALLYSSWSSDRKYFAQADGQLVTSKVVQIGKNLFGFSSTGTKWKKGAHRLGKNVYYATDKGYLRRNKWQKIGKREYFFDSNGRMTGQARYKSGKKTYFYRTNTAKKGFPVLKGGWQTDSDGNKYYATGSKGRLATGLKTIDGKLYFFSTSSGRLVKNQWFRYQKLYRHSDSKGVVETGWFNVGSKRYYGDSKGVRTTGLQNIDGNKYYFSRAGVLQTGWHTIAGKRYFFDPNQKGNLKGMVRTGWFNTGNKTYYAQADGAQVTGFVIYQGSRYFLNPNDNGAMAKNCTLTINGQKYSFDSNGRQIGWALSGPKTIYVDRQRNVLEVRQQGVAIKTFLCSTGRDNATPAGTFTIMDKLYLHELNGPTWGFYCSHITPDILFHSLPGSAPRKDAFPAEKYNLLGQQASQGCIRLRMGDAYWIYNNCPIGTVVHVGDYNTSSPKPVYKTIPTSLTIDPTDPDNPVNRGWA